MHEKQKSCLITWLVGRYAFFCCKIHFSYSFSHANLAENQSKEEDLVKNAVFRYSLAVTKESKKVTNLFQIGLFLHKKVKFANFSTKQVCNVNKKHFQCLVVNVDGNFLI